LFNYEKLIYYNCIDIDSDWFGDDEINTKKRRRRIEGEPNLISRF
jgi:hypothetical protein